MHSNMASFSYICNCGLSSWAVGQMRLIIAVSGSYRFFVLIQDITAIRQRYQSQQDYVMLVISVVLPVQCLHRISVHLVDSVLLVRLPPYKTSQSCLLLLPKYRCLQVFGLNRQIRYYLRSKNHDICLNSLRSMILVFQTYQGLSKIFTTSLKTVSAYE